jgi:hypothetical protein
MSNGLWVMPLQRKPEPVLLLPPALCEALVKLSLDGHGSLLCFSELPVTQPRSYLMKVDLKDVQTIINSVNPMIWHPHSKSLAGETDGRKVHT